MLLTKPILNLIPGSTPGIVLSLLYIALASLFAQTPPDMVQVPAGSYTPLYIQDASIKNVKPFFIDVNPISNKEFLDFVRHHPKWRRSQVKRLFADSGYLKHWRGDLDLGSQSSSIANQPVTNVSWFAARAYLKSKNKRLPTEDEWEYVAAADETRANASKDPAFTNRLLRWYSEPTTTTRTPPTPVNFYGIRALHGQVWEWVRDFNNGMVTGESRGDSGLERALFCAGGALGAADPHNYAAFMRYAFRSSLKGNYTVSKLGFRGARDNRTSKP